MFCKECGSAIDENTKFCPDCGVNRVLPKTAENIDSGLVLAIITTVLCCIPFGIVAIVYAAKVNDLVTRGRIAEAREAAAQSQKWSIIGIVSSLILIVLKVVFFASIA